MAKSLIIGDAHAHPEYDNDRFGWLGSLIVDERPDTIISVGDWYDMPSLSSYDKGTRGFEGRRYKKDIDAGNDALKRMWAPVDALNKQLSKNKKATYNPRFIFVMGNHDQGRMDKVANLHPELHETIGVQDMQLRPEWEVIKYHESKMVDGFCISHYHASGIMGRPIGGENSADTQLKKLHMSCISGHSHLLDIKTRTRPDGSKMMAIVAGTYGHDNQVEGWNRNSSHLWWNGLILLDGVENGYAQEIRTITQQRVKEKYG